MDPVRRRQTDQGVLRAVGPGEPSYRLMHHPRRLAPSADGALVGLLILLTLGPVACTCVDRPAMPDFTLVSGEIAFPNAAASSVEISDDPEAPCSAFADLGHARPAFLGEMAGGRSLRQDELVFETGVRSRCRFEETMRVEAVHFVVPDLRKLESGTHDQAQGYESGFSVVDTDGSGCPGRLKTSVHLEIIEAIGGVDGSEVVSDEFWRRVRATLEVPSQKLQCHCPSGGDCPATSPDFSVMVEFTQSAEDYRGTIEECPI